MTLDVFEPSKHIRAMPACCAAKKDNPEKSLKKVEAETGYNFMTVKRALAYAKLMENEGMSDPYRELTACPESASRWRHQDATCQELVRAT